MFTYLQANTQTITQMIQNAKFVDRLEDQLLKYPKQRVWQLEHQLAFEKQKYSDRQKEITELNKTVQSYNNFQLQLNDMNREIEEMTKKIQDETIPATLKVIKLKSHVLELYKRMGNDVTTSQYHTLVESEEFSELGPIVSAMLIKAANKEDKYEEDQDKTE